MMEPATKKSVANRFSLPDKVCGYSFDRATTGTQYRYVTGWSREYRPSGAGKRLQMVYGKTIHRWTSETVEKARTTDKTSDGNTGTYREQRKIARWIDTSRNIRIFTDRPCHTFSRTENTRVKWRVKKDPVSGQFFGVSQFLATAECGGRSLESLRKPANQVRGNRVIIAVRRVRRHAMELPNSRFLRDPSRDVKQPIQ